MDTIITRFPPSPTGYLHIGGARTALFNWLYARQNKGRFVLRIEDTDEARSTKESVEAIFESLEWLGIDWDEGPYFQTERYGIYKEYIQKLVDSGHAYYCGCSQEEVEAMREEARASGKKPMYNGKCRELNKNGKPGMVVRIKAPKMGSTVVEDVVKGSTSFPNSEIDDFIIQRSDGSPMYNLAVVIDDITMNINTIIRGDDHLVNTPKQIIIYNALGASLPLFAHVPMVLGSDKARLSKRHGAMSVSEYKEMGFLPDAMLNYLVRLGWSHGDQEFFTREELIEKFSLEHIGRSPSMFDMDKLIALNAKHIQSKPPLELKTLFIYYLDKNGVLNANQDEDFLDNNSGLSKDLSKNLNQNRGLNIEKIIESLQPRSKTMVEMAEASKFYFKEKIEFDESAAKKFLKPDIAEPLKKSVQYIQNLSDADFSEKNLEDIFKRILEESNLKFGKIAQPLRVALTGTTVSPGIFEMILALGKDITIERINSALSYIK